MFVLCVCVCVCVRVCVFVFVCVFVPSPPMECIFSLCPLAVSFIRVIDLKMETIIFKSL